MSVEDKVIMYQDRLKDAFSEVINVMIEGEKTHPENDWKDKALIEHIDHALAHIKYSYEAALYANVDLDINIREELSHAATRCIIALQLLLEGKK